MAPELKGNPGEPGPQPELDKRWVQDKLQEIFNDEGQKFWDGIRSKVSAMIPEAVNGKDGKDADPQAIIDEVERKMNARIKYEVSQIEIPVPEPTQLQVDTAFQKFHAAIRKDLLTGLTQIGHKGVYEPGTVYLPGDEVTKNDSTFRALEQTDSPPPSEAWQLIAKGKAGKRGEPGLKGDPGDKGDPGVGIKDAVWQDDQLILIREDGEAITVKIEDQRTKKEDEDDSED
jgi:hypothetical protein